MRVNLKKEFIEDNLAFTKIFSALSGGKKKLV